MIHILILLSVAYAGALSPPAEDDCALYLNGPARSTAYDYTINLLKGNFGYEGQHTCITYDAVNQAYLEARQRIVVSQPKGDWKPEDYASVGELVLDISINLARRYGLSYEEIEKGLPLIDTSRTLIREVCPPVFSRVECRAGKYRRLDGLCNNLRHPTWGATNAPFQRLLSPLFADGMNAPRIAHSGRDLPLSRVVSRTMHPDEGFHDHAGTVMVIAWGQFMDHDYTLTGTPLDPVNRNDPEECCKRPMHLKHPYCNEIRIPDDDYFYRLFGVKCIDFVRGFPSPRPGCRLGSRVPFNTLTGVIDGNTVYGVTEKFARKLRTGYGGLLRMNPVFKEYGLKDLLPLKLDIPDEGCTRPNKNMYCFEAGEIRVNEQLVLTVMHTLMAREHNRVANALAAVNPHWDDETLYQEARRINIAEIQHITYNEFLPILLGKDVMEKFGLVLEKQGYWDGYDPEVNPDVLASFAAAAYRFGHSLLPTAVERWSKAHKFIASKRLSDLIRRPYDLYRAGVLDEYVMGLMNQVAQAMDDSITQEVTNHLFKKVGARFGMDLVSFNMQRGREFGLPGYMEFRKFCGLPGAESFQELFGSMSNQTVQKYETIFERPDDVDLWSGGVSERPLPGSMLGPTFACIIATQFSYSRRGDRFWFELPNQPSSFTAEQLAELRKARLARVICDNTDIIDTVQLYPMVLPDHELNPRVPCRSGIIPSMDFSKWAEPAPFPATAKDFVTEALIQTIVMNATDFTSNQTNATLAGKASCTAERNTSACAHTQQPSSTSQTNVTDNSINNLQGTQATVVEDKILKYVYDSPKQSNESPKQNSHYKNSLRKKRSVNLNENNKAPLIVDYQTSHDREGNRETWLPAKSTANTIKRSELADFNIETLHEPVIIDDKQQRAAPNEHSHDSANVRTDSEEQSNQGSGESEETNSKYNDDDHKSNEQISSNESIQNKSNENDSENINPIENSKNNDNIKHKESENAQSSEESIEGVSEETVHHDDDKNHNTKTDDYNKHSVNDKLQDIDLDDFSYEKIKVSKNGKVIPVKDNDDYVSNENSKIVEELNGQSKENSASSSVESNEDNEPTHINDGEVKPVVEINTESDDDDTTEENSSQGDSRENNKNADIVDGAHESDGLSDHAHSGDLKQQFERVPLNYNHSSKSADDNSQNEEQNVDTDDTLPTKNTIYDENLKFKFSDISIKLPDIKLPEDVLSFADEGSPDSDTRNEKTVNDPSKKYDLFSSEEEQEPKQQNREYEESEETDSAEEQDDDAEHRNYDYYSSPYQARGTSRKKGDRDPHQDEDLYEKFVRERFGKRKNAGKRLEALTDYRATDPHLYNTVKNILKKTEEVKKQADDSGDPNAGYMWTLEYGEKL